MDAGEELRRETATRAMASIGRPMRDIGWAVKQLWHRQKVTRPGWNGRGMYLAVQMPDKTSKMSQPYVYMRTAQADLVPWLCSQTDLLATDWQLSEIE